MERWLISWAIVFGEDMLELPKLCTTTVVLEVAMPLPSLKTFKGLKSLDVQHRWFQPFSSNKLMVPVLLMAAKHWSSSVSLSDEMYALTLAMCRMSSDTPLTVCEMLLANALRIMSRV